MPSVFGTETDKRVRVVTKWQSLRHTKEGMNNIEDSEVALLRNIVLNLIFFQKQLDSSYRSDKY